MMECEVAMHPTTLTNSLEVWPALPQAAWSDTCATLQLWTQIVGKIRLALMPPINHSWNVTLYPTVRGLTTSPMPYGSRMLQIDFDFIDHDADAARPATAAAASCRSRP